jgi:hypothetical protein
LVEIEEKDVSEDEQEKIEKPKTIDLSNMSRQQRKRRKAELRHSKSIYIIDDCDLTNS